MTPLRIVPALAVVVLSLALCPTESRAQITRDLTTNDIKPYELNTIPVLPLVVDFRFADGGASYVAPPKGSKGSGAGGPQPPNFFTRAMIADKIYGLEDSKSQLNAYYYWASYGQVKLVPAQGLEDRLFAQVTVPLKNWQELRDRFSYDSRVGVIEEKGQDKNIMAFLLEAMKVLLADPAYANVRYQDAVMLVLVNVLGKDWGRGAMGFLPAGTYYELVVGPDPEKPDRKVAIAVGKEYVYRDYYLARKRWFDSQEDQFVRGVAIFNKDGQVSCAPHDIINVLKRFQAAAPKRGRAISGLYNNFLQDIWQGDGKTNPSPYIGWWDVMADHLHMRHTAVPPEKWFFRSIPQGMCAYTRILLGWMPKEYVATVESGTQTLTLAPVGVAKLPEPRGKVHLAIRVPLTPAVDKLGVSRERGYLIEARRRMFNDDLTLDKSHFYGQPAYVPDRLISEEGVLIYLVDPTRNLFGPKPVDGKVDRQDYVLVLQDQNDKGDEDLSDAAFSPGQVFKGQEGVTIEVAVDPADKGRYVVTVRR